MRLIDRNFAGLDWSESLSGLRSRGGHALNPGPWSAAVRYILDLPASLACADILRAGEDLFEPSNPLFRMPADAVWIEVFTEPDRIAQSRNGRVGFFVRSESSGRAGTIYPYEECANGSARPLPCRILFDLDDETALAAGPGYMIENPGLPHLRALLRMMRLQFHLEGIQALGAAKGFSCDEVKGRIAEGVWYALPILFAFSALLNSPQIVEQRESRLDRLNRARARRGKAPLLDHVEVRLTLGRPNQHTGIRVDHRSTPRLHLVRGHIVARSGKIFWRRAHLRGDTSHIIATRNVQVSASHGLRGRDAVGQIASRAGLTGG